jgi:hypothetical protein
LDMFEVGFFALDKGVHVCVCLPLRMYVECPVSFTIFWMRMSVLTITAVYRLYCAVMNFAFMLGYSFGCMWQKLDFSLVKRETY